MDIDAALKDGYSLAEVNAEAAKRAKFDYAGAKAGGYSDEEILGELRKRLGSKPKADFGTSVKQALASAGTAMDQAISLPAGALASVFNQEEGDKLFRDMDAREAKRKQWANPENLETTLGNDALAMALTLPAQIPAMLGQAATKGVDLVKRGEPLSRAVPATVADAALNAVGMGPMAPAKTFARRAAIGAAANVATGAGSDALTQLLATQEETKKAYDPYDIRRRALDAAVGGITQGAMGERPAKKPTKVDNIRAAQKQKAPEAKAPEAIVPEQLNLFDQFDERSPISPYQTEMAPDMWRVDENGIPIRADLSMEAQNLQQPLQRNLFGDELDANFPRDPNKPLDMATGDIPGVERFSDPVQFRNDPEGQIPLTEAIDNMPEGIRNRENGKFAPGTTRQSALNLLRGELFPDDAVRTAVQEADMQQWLRENAVDNKKPAPLGSKARKEQVRKMGWAKKQGGGVMMDPFGRIPDSSDKLQDLLKSVPYRFQTLEGLPNKEKVTFEQIKQVVNREGVSAAEKSLIQDAYAIALFTNKNDFVTARELVDGLQEAIQDLTLKPAKTAEYADYGLNSIGRDAGTKWEPIPRAEWTPEQVREYQEYNVFPKRKVITEGSTQPTTRIWETQASQLLPVEGRPNVYKNPSSHFPDAENYVGHTRSFIEEGVRHVIELQSDLLQKPLKEKQTNPQFVGQSDSALRTRHSDLLGQILDLDKTSPKRDVLLREAFDLAAELKDRETNTQARKQKPLQSNWVVRLIREELGDAAKKGETSVRFASADTMAKVEGWTKDITQEMLDRRYYLRKKVGDEEYMLRSMGVMDDPDWFVKLKQELAETERAIQEAQFPKQLQGIYDRYQKEVTKYLTSIGGKPMVDDKGHSWIEVPVEKHRQRPIMFGQRGVLKIDWADETKKMENSMVSGDFIPTDPSIPDTLAKARTESDSKLWKYTQSGGTSAAMKSGSTLIQAVSRTVQNSLKRAELQIRNSVFPAETALRKLSKQEIGDLHDVFKDEMFQGYRYNGDVLAKHLSVKQIEAYTKMRDMFDVTLSAQNAARVAQGKAPITAQEAYMSSRWQGDFRRPVYDTDGKLVWYLAGKTKWDLEAQTKALLKEQPNLVIDKSEDHTVKSLRGGADIQSMYSTMLDILGRNDPAVLKMKELVETSMGSDVSGMLAQEKHFEKKGNVRGFVGDRPGKVNEAVKMFEQQIQYAKNAFKWSEMQKSADNLGALLSDPELQANQKHNVAFAREYVKNALGQGESQLAKAIDDSFRNMGVSPQVISEAVGGVKSFFIMQKLAVSAGYTLSNLVQTSNVLPYLMNLRSQGYKGNPAVAVTVGVPMGLAMSISHYLKATGGEYLSRLPDEFYKAAFKYAEENGVTARSVYDEAPLETGFSPVSKAANIASKTMTIPETFVRSVAFMTYAQMLKDSGKFSDMKQLFQKAEELVNMSMVDYRETERPLAFSKAGTAGNFLNTLQTYPISFYNQWLYMGGEAAKGRPAGILAMGALQVAVAGAMGIPGFEDADKLYKWVRDNMLSTGTWNKVMKNKFLADPKLWLMENLGEASVYGALSDETGIGLTSRVAAPGAGAMLQSPIGPVVDIAKQVGNFGKAVADPTNTTKWAQAAMGSIPTGLQGFLETQPFMKDSTFVENEDGTKTFMKTSDLEDRRGGYTRNQNEVDMRAWGLRSQDEVVTRDASWSAVSANQTLNEKTSQLIDRVYSAARRGDTKKVAELMNLYTELTGNEISATQIENQLKEERLSDLQREGLKAGENPRKLLNVGRVQKFLEERK